jgi:hypothetical protein
VDGLRLCGVGGRGAADRDQDAVEHDVLLLCGVR